MDILHDPVFLDQNESSFVEAYVVVYKEKELWVLEYPIRFDQNQIH